MKARKKLRMTTRKEKADIVHCFGFGVVESCSLVQFSCPQTEPNLRAIYHSAPVTVWLRQDITVLSSTNGQLPPTSRIAISYL